MLDQGQARLDPLSKRQKNKKEDNGNLIKTANFKVHNCWKNPQLPLEHHLKGESSHDLIKNDDAYLSISEVFFS